MEVSGQLKTRATILSEKETSVSVGQECEWAAEPVWTPRKENNPSIRDSSVFHFIALSLFPSWEYDQETEYSELNDSFVFLSHPTCNL
jgi:hypothetical protein